MTFGKGSPSIPHLPASMFAKVAAKSSIEDK